MTSIHQIAFNNQGKVSREKARALILGLAETYPEATPELGLLLAYFGPPVAKIKDAFGWVALAVAKKDLRRYLRLVFCADGFAVGTDGRRLHAAPCDLPPGLYDPKSRVRLYGLDPLEEGHPGKFPDWRRVAYPDSKSHPSAPVTDPVFKGSTYASIPVITRDGDGLADGVPAEAWRAMTLRCDTVAWGGRPYFTGPGGELGIIMPFVPFMKPKR